MFEILEQPIDVYDLLLTVDSEYAQGINLKVDAVPKVYEGKKIKYLEVKTNGSFTAKQVEAIIEKAKKKWDIIRVSVLQRQGNLFVGDIITAIAVSSYNPKDVIHTIGFIAEEMSSVHIWRRFYFEDGSIKVSSHL